MQKLAIIGAGLSGTSLAAELAGSAEITIFEKSRGLGGRMATRRRAQASFDHGAQYFTIRDPHFRHRMDGAMQAGVVALWDGLLMERDETGQVRQSTDRHGRFVAVPAMSALARHLADGLAVLCSLQIQSVEGGPGDWYLTTKGGVYGPYDWVVSSAPAPQTQALLPLSALHKAALDQVRMSGCFTLMIDPPADTDLPFAACRLTGHPILGFIAANHSKPGRAPDPALVVHARNDWSQAHLDTAPDTVRDLMLEACRSLFPTIGWSEARMVDLHRWRYANVETPLGSPFLIDADRQLAACGDWCIGNRVEAAFLSGFHLAQALKALDPERDPPKASA
ncbi:NAD(P)-binding protein [Rhizobium sp. SSA_523]|nr:NAD(P)-binding protein [Rhizobium sp. SSA_523]MCO5732129.1 NAD(P)-binding protein [Rhizobium sp. SSA_523]WKC25689.1 NAD(P)-binding protein [Rhizobium sp. SSA_523]